MLLSKKHQQDYTQWVFIWMVCNAKCCFCNTQKATKRGESYYKFYNLEIIKKDIKWKVSKWATCIVYEWGDFSLHPEIFNILEFWQSLWIKQTFQTNWIKLADYEFVKKLKKYWVNEMNFSIHAFEEKISDNIVGIKWWFKKTIKWVMNCNKLWMTISNNLVLINENINQLKWIIFLMFRLNIKLFNITMYIPVNGMSEDFHHRFMVNPKDFWNKAFEMLKLYKKIIKLSEWKLKLNLKFHNAWRCIFDKKYHNIDYEFNLDRREEDYKYIQDTWFYKKEECKKCIYYYNCTWFTEKYIKIFWDDYIKPILS